MAPRCASRLALFRLPGSLSRESPRSTGSCSVGTAPLACCRHCPSGAGFDGQVAHVCHHIWDTAAADLGQIFPKGDVSYPVDSRCRWLVIAQWRVGEDELDVV